jgi:hypothetical protein
MMKDLNCNMLQWVRKKEKAQVPSAVDLGFTGIYDTVSAVSMARPGMGWRAVAKISVTVCDRRRGILTPEGHLRIGHIDEIQIVMILWIPNQNYDNGEEQFIS